MDVYTLGDMITALQDAFNGQSFVFNLKNDIYFTSTLLINKSLDIYLENGSGHENVTLMLAEAGAFRHFSTGGAAVNDLSVTAGGGIVLNGGGTGGGIQLLGSNCLLMLEDCVITACKNSGNGGGVLVQGSTARSAIIMNHTVIENCQALAGGGIFASDCDVGMTGGEITGNRAINAGGGIAAVAGGNRLGSTITIYGGKIYDNVSTGDGGGIEAHDAIVTIGNSEISGNVADGNGGGIYALNQTRINELNALVISDSIIANNTIRNFGGGIRVENALSEFTITNCTIIGNKAVSAQTGSKQGGGIYLSEASLTLRDTKISANEAGSSGGGVFANFATLTVGGATEISQNEAAITAGGIYGYQGCTIIIEDDAQITDNHAYCGNDPENASRGGGGIALLSYGYGSKLTVKGNALIGNNTSVSYGGGIWTYPIYGPETIVNIEGGAVEGNTANYGGGISMGEIPNYTPILKITGGKIIGNVALTDGGGIIAKGSIVTVANSVIAGNHAGRDGGGIFTDQLENVTEYADAAFADNTAASYVYWQITSGGDSDIHKTHIFTTQFSTFIPEQTLPLETWSFTNAYNNYDINYYRLPIQTVTVNLAEAGTPSYILHSAIIDSFLGATVMIPPRNTFIDVNGILWALEPPDQPAQILQLTEPDGQYSVTFYNEIILSDVTVTEHYIDMCGRQIMRPTQTIVNRGDDYRKSAPVIMGFTFVGHKIDNGPLQAGEVIIVGIEADTEVVFMYAKNHTRPCNCVLNPCAMYRCQPSRFDRKLRVRL